MQRKMQGKLVLVGVPVTRPYQCGTMETLPEFIRFKRVPASMLAFSVFHIVPSAPESCPYRKHLLPTLGLSRFFMNILGGRLLLGVVRKCGKTRLQGRGESSTRLEEWNSFSSLRVKWYFWLQARETEESGWCRQDWQQVCEGMGWASRGSARWFTVVHGGSRSGWSFNSLCFVRWNQW